MNFPLLQDSKNRTTYAQIAQKEAADRAAAAATLSATSQSGAATTGSLESANVTESSNSGYSKKVVKDQAVKSNFQGKGVPFVRLVECLVKHSFLLIFVQAQLLMAKTHPTRRAPV